MIRKRDSLKFIEPANREEWRNWLLKNHTQKESVWLRITKKGYSGLTRLEATEEILCFGWIDGVVNKIDEQYFKILVAPRKPKSIWSKINKAHIKGLIKSKLMQPSGLAAIALAKKNGSWNTLNDIDQIKYPNDLISALRNNKKAKTNFESFPPSAKKIILFWIQEAKTPETRLKRIVETVSKASKNERANQYVKK